MGKICSICSKKVQTSVEQVNAIFEEKEIKIPSYESNGDKYFQDQEKKYNYLSKIIFKDYLFSVINFSEDTAKEKDEYSNVTLEQSAEYATYSEQISPDMFQSFIENKILSHKSVHEEARDNERATSIFKKIASENYTGLAQKLAQNIKEKGLETKDKDEIITKGHLIALGILLCSGPNYIKIRLIFNLFKVDENLKKNEKLNDFLLSLFLIAGYGAIHVRNQLSEFEEIGSVEKSELIKLAETSELKNIQHLVEVTNKLIFGDDLSQSLNYEAFKAKFEGDNKDTSLGFMLSPSGVRYMETLHNI